MDQFIKSTNNNNNNNHIVKCIINLCSVFDVQKKKKNYKIILCIRVPFMLAMHMMHIGWGALAPFSIRNMV